MNPIGLAVVALALVGTVLVLAEVPWFARRPMAERLGGHLPGRRSGRPTTTVWSTESLRDALTPLAGVLGARGARLFGVREDAERRLRRIHAGDDAAGFRIRQLGWATAALAAAAVVVTAATPGPFIGLGVLAGAPLLAFLVVEDRLARASRDWQRRTLAELPVVVEQLGMLLGAGYSLGSALDRLATRGNGVVSADLGRLVQRMQQGLTEIAALREWADLAGVDALDRLVGVLALNRDAGDLGRLIAEEARSIRRDSQRDLVEAIERRNQQVWIPVTVATLLPGVTFMAVPFVEALSLFTGS